MPGMSTAVVCLISHVSISNMLLHFTIQLSVLVIYWLTVEKFKDKQTPTLNKNLVKNVVIK